MSYNKNEGYGALGRYVELTNNLLKLTDTKIFFISPEGFPKILIGVTLVVFFIKDKIDPASGIGPLELG